MPFGLKNLPLTPENGLHKICTKEFYRKCSFLSKAILKTVTFPSIPLREDSKEKRLKLPTLKDCLLLKMSLFRETLIKLDLILLFSRETWMGLSLKKAALKFRDLIQGMRP